MGLAGREQDLVIQREHLAAEVEAAKRAAEAVAEERAALQQRSALLDSEREQFRGWMRDAREEAARSIKVGRSWGVWEGQQVQDLVVVRLHSCVQSFRAHLLVDGSW